MTDPKPVFLLTKAIRIVPTGPLGVYDSTAQLTVLASDPQTPMIVAQGTAPTQSKTNAWPGDDDPDPARPRCY